MPTQGGIPTYEQWMKDTHTWTKARSNELKALDEAIKAFNNSSLTGRDAMLHRIREALNRWKAKEGNHWFKSVRNEKDAIARLDAYLNDIVHGGGLTRQEKEAWEYVLRAARDNCRQMFQGKTLTVKRTAMACGIGEVSSAANTVKSTIQKCQVAKVTTPAKLVSNLHSQFGQVPKALHTAGQGIHQYGSHVVNALPNMPQGLQAFEGQIHQLLMALFDTTDLHVVMDALGPLFGQIVSDLTPFLGMAKNGAQAVVAWIKVAKQTWDRSKVKDGRESFAPGDPAAAFAAIMVIVNRNLEAQVADASIITTAFGAQVGLFFADGGAISGPVVGATKSVAQLLSTIIQFARDWKEMRDANKQLSAGPWDFTLFKKSPLLGCYLISCSDTSSVINLSVAQFGSIHWMDQIERLVERAGPAIVKAGDLIRASRYEIAEMRNSKGVVAPTPKVFGKNPISHAMGLYNSATKIQQNVENRLNSPLRGGPKK